MKVAAIAGQVGCVTLVIVFAALLGGLLLDRLLDSRPIFTILLMVGSVPVTLVVTFWLVRKATSGMHLDSSNKSTVRNEEED